MAAPCPSESSDNSDDKEEEIRDFNEVRYTIVRLLDGRAVLKVRESSFLRAYLPYPPSAEALCNNGNGGGYGTGMERMVPCSVLEYVEPRPFVVEVDSNEHSSAGLDAPEHVRVQRARDVLKATYRVAARVDGAVVDGSTRSALPTGGHHSQTRGIRSSPFRMSYMAV